jgi:hypothetical protein
MAKSKPIVDKSSDDVPTPKSRKRQEQKTESQRFVVTRDGYRVTDLEYSVQNDEKALSERDFWNRVSSKSKDGTKVLIVPFDSKLHRVW